MSFAKSKIVYPVTKTDAVVETYFNTQVPEPYRWLENDTAKTTIAWVNEQNKVTQNYLSAIPFRDALKSRLREINNYPKYGVPSKKHGYFYFYNNNGLQNQSVLYRSKTDNCTQELVLDPNTLSADGTVSLNAVEISANGKYLAYSISRSGSDWNEIYVMDLDSKKLLGDVVKWVKFSGISWQGNGFYYSAYDAPKAGKEYSGKNEYHKIFYHQLGETQEQDKLIFENKEFPLRNCGAGISDDERFLFISETESTSGN
jgi:prolyl oligopeptidase